MIIRIALISGVALVAYVIVPAVSAAIKAARGLRLLRRLANGIPCTLSDIADGKAIFKCDRSRNDDGSALALLPSRTVFLLLGKDGRIQAIRWTEISTVLVGTTALVYSLDDERFACLFHEELRALDAERRVAAAALARFAPERPDPVKALSIAAGTFAEFVFLLDALKHPEMDAIAILALVAIFGKALPWCPPGLALTLIAKSLARGARRSRMATGEKKYRRISTVGILVAGFAVALNVALIFFVIVKVWIPIP